MSALLAGEHGEHGNESEMQPAASFSDLRALARSASPGSGGGLDNDVFLDSTPPSDATVVLLTRLAATHIDTGLSGRLPYSNLESALHGVRPWRVGLHLWRSNFGWVVDVVCLTLVAMTMVERPSWCFGGSDELCDSVRHSGLFRLSRSTSLGVELAFLSLIFVDAVNSLLLMLPDWRRWLHGWFRPARMLFALVALVDVVVFDLIVAPERRFRLSPYLRAVIAVCLLSSVRRVGTGIVRAMPHIGTVLLLQATWISFSAWCSLVLFRDLPDNVHFGEFWTAMWSLLILTTTCNFPDVSLPYLNSSVLYIGFFVVYICVSIYVLQSFVLATVFTRFQVAIEAKESEKVANNRVVAFGRAFDLLVQAQRRADDDESKRLKMHTFQWLVTELNRFRAVPYIDVEHTRLYFKSADISNRGAVARSDFFRLGEVLDLTFTRVGARPWLHRCIEQCLGYVPRWFDRACRIVLDPNFSYLADVFVALNCALVAASQFANLPLASGHELAFAVVYFCDQLVKIVAHGSFLTFWRATSLNKFDFLVTVTSLIMEITFMASDVVGERLAARLVEILRMFRFLRLFHIVPTFRAFAATSSRLTAVMVPVAVFTVLVLFEFALLGINFFGGLPERAFDNSPYAVAGYQALNFNDMMSACTTVFSLIVVNNWYVIASGFVAATGSSGARLYFVTIWLGLVVILLNVIISTIIQQFAVIVGDERRQAEDLAIDPTLLTGIDGIVGVGDEVRLQATTRGDRRLRATASKRPASQ